MKVRPYEALRFYVSSQEKPGEEYLVDLLENNGVGRCTCPHFSCRIQPFAKYEEISKGSRCKHLRAALLFLADQTVLAYQIQEAAFKRESSSRVE